MCDYSLGRAKRPSKKDPLRGRVNPLDPMDPRGAHSCECVRPNNCAFFRQGAEAQKKDGEADISAS